MEVNSRPVLPEGITRGHILLAIEKYEKLGLPNGYKPSHTYDIEHLGKRYPPPAIVALAAAEVTGTLPAPGFRAGKGTKCFQILTDCGFSIMNKENAGE